MLRFRPRSVIPPPADVRQLIADVLRPAHFVVASPLALEWDRGSEDLAWEVFQGRLLEPAHTRQRRAFKSWHFYVRVGDQRSGEPLLSVKLDPLAGQVYVVRGLECYAWEGYADGNVIQSRERRKWVRELVGTIDLARFPDPAELHDELICLLFLAIVGTSRLPLHSVESPLPAFTFGELFYCYQPERGMPDLAEPERVKRLELTLRSASAVEIADRVTSTDIALLHRVFNDASLSPWTDFVDRVLVLLHTLEARGQISAETVIDFLGRQLRQTVRHLTAYDLNTFHFRGANYPDALLLDAVLKAYLGWIERRPDLFLDGPRARLRRRALRQAWMLRHHYEGHPVPDLPTTPGENSRVLPPSHPRVPEEQILQSSQRTRKLFDGDPLPQAQFESVLRQAFADLSLSEELHELGIGLFIDRPFGTGKAPAEPDATPLLAATAYSRSIAERRVNYLTRDLGLLSREAEQMQLHRLAGEQIRGLPLDAIGGPDRPAAIGLGLARQAATDFVFLHSTRGSVAALTNLFDFAPLSARLDLGFLTGTEPVLMARSAHGPGVRIYDSAWQPRLELQVAAGGFLRRAGVEYPANGLDVVGAWAADGSAIRLESSDQASRRVYPGGPGRRG